MRFNKKASMELGISTVVVLVIAMVIIAGGIAFIRGFFGKGTKELDKGFDLSQLGKQPSSTDPLVFVQGNGISMKSGSEEEVKVAFFNKDPTMKNVRINFSSCSTSVTIPSSCGSTVTPMILSVPKEIKSGESFGFITIVTASCKDATGSGKTNLPAGKYICTLQAREVSGATVSLAENQFIFEITP
jgi:hypothetical protein